jgi:hypothetical protein
MLLTERGLSAPFLFGRSSIPKSNIAFAQLRRTGAHDPYQRRAKFGHAGDIGRTPRSPIVSVANAPD